MAVCKTCHQEMMTADSCTPREGAIRYGNERRFGELEPEILLMDCNDCGVKTSGYHHPWCDIEECPHGCGQLLCCEHNDEQWSRSGAHD